MRWAAQLVDQLSRHGAAGWDRVRPPTGALVAATVYLVAVYLIGRR